MKMIAVIPSFEIFIAVTRQWYRRNTLQLNFTLLWKEVCTLEMQFGSWVQYESTLFENTLENVKKKI
jgi:hypothetical protein